MPQYIIANPETKAIHYPQLLSLREAKKRRDWAIETYGITTDFKICRVVPIEISSEGRNVHG